VPRWLRHALLAYLQEALWERPRPAGAATRDWDRQVEELLARWREPARSPGAPG
jgi:hypothetical protein